MTDTEIRHITPVGSNIFEDLGFEPAEAAQMKAQVQLEIDAAQSIKRQLMDEIAHWIEDNQLKQAEAAEVLNISRPRVSDVVNHKTTKFTIDALVAMLARTGKRVQVQVYT
ncbi:helix-turn-helix domain-containing protein [Deinococcus radiophilus]|uniref:XRE family transcriptional regulator n=1 Tax=Deinococcus radiophilus TaxID=32062 RepID=A0A431VKF1_9DEIO|nr:XRE family transcriptional regulator [Deinococcus radiophilus]RTR22110.1 XRE family transcriptional regulator [Deinococcus radiophilus]UFA51924.1 XRE family transcriptional regulator [Deinococcus radiophilus]